MTDNPYRDHVEIAAYLEQIRELNALIINLQQELQTHIQQNTLLESELQEHAIEASREFKLFFDAAPLPLLTLDGFGNIRNLNTEAEGFFGLKRSEMIGKSFRSYLTYSCFGDFTHHFNHFRSGHGDLKHFHHLSLRNDTHFSLLAKKIITTKNHVDTLYLGVINDLSSAAMQGDYLSHVALEQLREAVLITDDHGIILQVNNAFTEITGFTRDEALGANPKILKSGRHTESFYREMWEEIEHHGWWAGEIWNRRKNDQVYPEWLQISRITEPVTHKIYYISTFSDITERKKHQNRLDRMAHYDTLTGLMNRQFLKVSLESLIERTESESGKLALFFMDLDHFKQINDRYGHHEGDLILQETAQRILATVRNYDIVSRIGGDEFVLVIPRYNTVGELEMIGDKLVKEIAKAYYFNDNTHHIGTSIGIALYPEDGEDVETLMKHADSAMYRAKESGRNRIAFFTPEDEKFLIMKEEIKALLRQSIAAPQHHIRMHYQPVYDAQSGTLRAFEALVRIMDHEARLVSPDLFITTAEEEGFIIGLGDAIFSQVCRFVQENGRLGLVTPPIAINLSPLQLADAALVERFGTIAAAHALSLERFDFEVTETAAMQHLQEILMTLKAFREAGCQLLLDDFGTGYASLSQLHDIPVDIVKIDRSFVTRIEEESGNAQKMIQAMLAMADALGLYTVIEGVETHMQYTWLRDAGARFIQGYYFSKPLDERDIREKFLTS